jgi:hypothetical protein
VTLIGLAAGCSNLELSKASKTFKESDFSTGRLMCLDAIGDIGSVIPTY